MKKILFLIIFLLFNFFNKVNWAISPDTFVWWYCNNPEWYEDTRPLKVLSLLIILALILLFYLKTDIFSNISIKKPFLKITFIILIIIILNEIILHSII